jgi:hypothetical protein
LRQLPTFQLLRQPTPDFLRVISYENARNPKGSWRLILEDLAVQSDLVSSGDARPILPPTCIGG